MGSHVHVPLVPRSRMARIPPSPEPKTSSPRAVIPNCVSMMNAAWGRPWPELLDFPIVGHESEVAVVVPKVGAVQPPPIFGEERYLFRTPCAHASLAAGSGTPSECRAPSRHSILPRKAFGQRTSTAHRQAFRHGRQAVRVLSPADGNPCVRQRRHRSHPFFRALAKRTGPDVPLSARSMTNGSLPSSRQPQWHQLATFRTFPEPGPQLLAETNMVREAPPEVSRYRPPVSNSQSHLSPRCGRSQPAR